MVFPKVVTTASIQQSQGLFRLPAALPNVVNHLGLGNEIDLPPGLSDPATPVYLLGVEEEMLIQQAHLFHHLPPNHHTGPGNEIDAAHLIMARQVAEVPF